MQADSEDDSQRLLWLALGYCSALLFYVLTQPLARHDDVAHDESSDVRLVPLLIFSVIPLLSVVLVGVWILFDGSAIALALSDIQTRLSEGQVVYYFQGPLRLAIVGSMVYIISFQFGQFMSRRYSGGQVAQFGAGFSTASVVILGSSIILQELNRSFEYAWTELIAAFGLNLLNALTLVVALTATEAVSRLFGNIWRAIE